MMNGFLEARGGAGDPSGSEADPEPPERKEEKLAGVSAVASAGGGRPVIFASIVRIQRINVYIPSTWPNVCRRFPSCSALLNMAKKDECVVM